MVRLRHLVRARVVRWLDAAGALPTCGQSHYVLWDGSALRVPLNGGVV